MCTNRIKRQRIKLWNKDPHCENCGIKTILPEDVPEIDPSNMKVYPPGNMATIQHKYPRGSKKRQNHHTNERKRFLWCHKCNCDDNKKNGSGLLNNKIK